MPSFNMKRYPMLRKQWTKWITRKFSAVALSLNSLKLLPEVVREAIEVHAEVLDHSQKTSASDATKLVTGPSLVQSAILGGTGTGTGIEVDLDLKMTASNAVDMGTRRETAKRGVPLDLPTRGEVMILTTLATEDPEETDTETETTEKAAEEVAREDTTDEVLAEATVGVEDEMIKVILQPVTTGGGIEKKSKELQGHYLSQDRSQETD
jgi:hypothetical protein